MPRNVAQKLIADHLVEGGADPGQEIGLRVDQTLTQDATGTMVMLELEAMGLDRIRTELSVQYVDHNLLQTDWKNPDDHLFLESAARRFGLWFSKAGNGVSHPVHQAHFGRPGAVLIGSDSHTCAAGALGMLAIGVGGLEIAMAMAGQPLYVSMPEIWGVELTGRMPDWTSAKDVVLEMLRRHGVTGGVGRIIEYRGEGLAQLTAMDRHVIANMGAELGATATVFPADDAARSYLESVGRAAEFTRIEADEGASYDLTEHIDLDALEPLIARPSSPGNVVPVASVAGEEVSQVVVGSSANPGLRDFAVVAEILEGRQAAPGVSLDINPTSREVLADLITGGWLTSLVAAGARIHQSGCMGCIGMGQAPASGRNSLRTMPRNFPGRSGTEEDAVWLCSPETAAAAALTGQITDPRTLEQSHDMTYPRPTLPEQYAQIHDMLIPPLPAEEAQAVELVKGPNISSLPDFEPVEDRLAVPALLVMGDDVSTDEILPAGSAGLPFARTSRGSPTSPSPEIDQDYPTRARETEGGVRGGGGEELRPGLLARACGDRAAPPGAEGRDRGELRADPLAEPRELRDRAARVRGPRRSRADLRGRRGGARGVHEALRSGGTLVASIAGRSVSLTHRLSDRQVDMVLAGGRIPLTAQPV